MQTTSARMVPYNLSRRRWNCGGLYFGASDQPEMFFAGHLYPVKSELILSEYVSRTDTVNINAPSKSCAPRVRRSTPVSGAGAFLGMEFTNPHELSILAPSAPIESYADGRRGNPGRLNMTGNRRMNAARHVPSGWDARSRPIADRRRSLPATISAPAASDHTPEHSSLNGMDSLRKEGALFHVSSLIDPLPGGLVPSGFFFPTRTHMIRTCAALFAVILSTSQLDAIHAAASSQATNVPVYNTGNGKPAKVTGVKGNSCKCGKGSTVKVK